VLSRPGGNYAARASLTGCDVKDRIALWEYGHQALGSRVLGALRDELQPGPWLNGEIELQAAAAAAIEARGLIVAREVQLGAGCRVDIVVRARQARERIGVEVKIRPLAKSRVLDQLERYARRGVFGGLILLSEASVGWLPRSLPGREVAKPCLLWGLQLLSDVGGGVV
jgi:hypothetical protein